MLEAVAGSTLRMVSVVAGSEVISTRPFPLRSANTIQPAPQLVAVVAAQVA